MTKLSRRSFIQATGASAALGAAGALGFPFIGRADEHKKVVVIGGGSGGAIAARYIKRADTSIDVTLIEQNDHYYTCYMSNEVISGERDINSIRFTYGSLSDEGIRVVHERASMINAEKKMVMTEQGNSFPYERLVVSPGIAFRWGEIEGYDMAAAEKMPHAYQAAGEQTMILRKQLEAMDDGGVVIIAPPDNSFRCPPGPYERACQIAHYLKNNKPKSKLMIIDAKDKFSKQGLFTHAWEKLYKGMIEWVPGSETGGGIVAVQADKMIVSTEFEDIQGDVINMIPPQTASEIAHAGGLVDESGWCPVDLGTFESTMQPNVHVIGDASIATGLPKSAYAANSEAKVCAAAVVAMINGEKPGTPSYVNTCYSLAAPGYGFSVASVHRLADDRSSIEKISGGLSDIEASEDTLNREAQYAYSWYENIVSDMFGAHSSG